MAIFLDINNIFLLMTTLTLLKIIAIDGDVVERPSNVASELWEILQSKGSADALVDCRDISGEKRGNILSEDALQQIGRLTATSDTRSASSSASRDYSELVNLMEAVSSEAMSPVTQLSGPLGIDFVTLWLVNMIFVKNVTLAQVVSIAGLDTVVLIRSEKVFKIMPPGPPKLVPKLQPTATGNDTWNIGQIDARCTTIKCLGEGVVVGVMDTGFFKDHDELVGQWRPEFGWLDASFGEPEPYDLNGHGTHVTATIVGKTVGVAPGAKFISCGMPTFSEAAILLCGQFMFCPTSPNDTTVKSCPLRPHVINNSWGGGGGAQFFQPSMMADYDMIRKWQAAGIISTFAMGNQGPACGSGDRPGTYDIVLSVGATTDAPILAYFSSRGGTVMAEPLSPNSTANGTCRFPQGALSPCLGKDIKSNPICMLTKPDVVAPGVNIRSAWNTGKSNYATISGTSMATPHLTGVVALMMCANPNPEGGWTQKLVYDIVTGTADTKLIDLKGEKHAKNDTFAISSHILCNVLIGLLCDGFPNNLYGHGIVNACAAVAAAMKLA